MDMDKRVVMPGSLAAGVIRVFRSLLNERVEPVRLMRLVETLPLGPKRWIHLVECDGQSFLVAAGADNMSAPVSIDRLQRERL
jgi:flagellar biogenesis protein FliO